MRVVLLLFLLLPVAERALAQTEKAIADSHRLFFAALAGGDSAAFVDRFATDSWIMGPGGGVSCGDGAAGELFVLLHKGLCVRSGRFITADVFGNSGEFATELGFYQLFDGAGRIVGDGSLMVLWRKTSAGWKMFRTSFNK